MNNAGVRGEAELGDAVRTLFGEAVVKLDADGVGLKFLGGHDDDASVSRAQVVDFFAGFYFAEAEHFVDDGFGGGVIRSEFFSLILGEQSKPEKRGQYQAHQSSI